LIAAIAFESVIKLVAFLAAGLFITYGVFNGFSDLFQQAIAQPRLQQLFTLQENNAYTSWFSMLTLSFFAMLFLPRQFQVNVVENLDENHLKTASWVFPLYLFVINLFVIPIALAGSVLYPATTVNPDLYVLNIPLDQGKYLLSLLIFIGGFSAATGMIIVETIALTTMISNHLALPLLFSTNRLHQESRRNLSAVVLWVRRGSILLVIGLALLYDKLVAEQYSLVSIGLVSFAAVAQLAPAVLGGLYWKGASKNGALAGLAAGFICWMFTLLLPSLAGAGLLDKTIVENGYFGVAWLKPDALFGLNSLDPVSHSLFWSLLLNSGFFVLVSINSQKGSRETFQAELFVDFLNKEKFEVEPAVWKNTASLPALRLLLQNFIGTERTASLFQKYANRHQIPLNTTTADPRLVQLTEKILAGVIGSASAHILVSRVAKAEELSMEEVLNLLRESQQIMELNKELKRKSVELTRATEQLSALNRQLMAMDEVKDEFLYTITHELRTPLTSIRALTELVHDNPEMPVTQKTEFLAAVVRETERLSHLITQVLSLERFESGKHPLELQTIRMNDLIEETLTDIQQLVQQKKLRLEKHIDNPLQTIELDPVLIRQVFYNLLSNAIRFSPESGTITLAAVVSGEYLELSVADQGKGIPEAALELIFDKFYQVPNQSLKKPEGSGLGLAISKKIIELHAGNIRAENKEEGGARFIFILPFSQPNL
ncbi:MAG: ATP-binding protein, partial [Flavihumibacter sp.]|nr:ATP-binding protein [Flavihumibacter sp.]